jgi:predicted transcriptional regulator
MCLNGAKALYGFAAMNGQEQGVFISFETPEWLFQTMTQLRWNIIKAITGVGPLSIREIARRVGRDVKAVHRDVHACRCVMGSFNT